MKCPDEKIIQLIGEHNQASDFQAVRCLYKCSGAAISIMRKLGGEGQKDECESAFGHALADFIVQVRSGKYQLAGAAKICSYVTEMAKRKWLQFSRKNKMPEAVEIPEEEPESEKEKRKQKIKSALQQLTFSDQDILTAFYFYDMPLDEYAEKKKITHEAAKQRLSRARARLRILLIN